MALCAAILLVLLSPGPTVELKYKSKTGVTYRDASTTVNKLRLFSGTRIVKHHIEVDRVLDRTVIGLDDEGRPVRERITVAKFIKRTVASPTDKEGEKAYPSHGKTFIWKDRKLYDESGDVTKKFVALAAALTNDRDLRLPRKPVGVGDSWTVSAVDFLRASGQRVEGEVKGEWVFTLKAIEGGVARIAFTGKRSQDLRGRTVTGTNTGTWLFDVNEGRDREFKMNGKIVVGRREGDGTLAMTRTVTAKR